MNNLTILTPLQNVIKRTIEYYALQQHLASMSGVENINRLSTGFKALQSVIFGTSSAFYTFLSVIGVGAALTGLVALITWVDRSIVSFDESAEAADSELRKEVIIDNITQVANEINGLDKLSLEPIGNAFPELAMAS